MVYDVDIDVRNDDVLGFAMQLEDHRYGNIKKGLRRYMNEPEYREKVDEIYDTFDENMTEMNIDEDLRETIDSAYKDVYEEVEQLHSDTYLRDFSEKPISNLGTGMLIGAISGTLLAAITRDARAASSMFLGSSFVGLYFEREHMKKKKIKREKIEEYEEMKAALDTFYNKYLS